jgi:predicted GNAT family N-acyltransferase
VIQQLDKNEFQSLSVLITMTVKECIEADNDTLELIIKDSLLCSKRLLDGELEGISLVYKHDGKVVGFILIIDFWNMANLFVLPDFHGKGIATELVNEALKLCKNKYPEGFVKLNSSSFASNFYKKYGFLPNGEPKKLPGGCIPYVYNF